MVKYRGISVSMISQHGIRKLPEYEPPISADPFRITGPTLRSEQDSIASCYVPSYPGSQIWFDYAIDNPHPPNAQYFFKLLHNGKVFTSWDCTAKYDYQGRSTYGLKYLGTHPQTGQPVVERQAFRFSTEQPNHVGPFDNCVEVRVHRVEHRVRLSIEEASVTSDELIAGENVCHDGFRLINGGVLAPNDPKRHYKYQLLDPVDKPYATIRFYYRPMEFLTANGVVRPSSNHSRQASMTSGLSRTSSEFSNAASRSASKASSTRSPARSDGSAATGSSRRGSPPTDSIAAWLYHHRLQKYTSVLAPLSFDTLVTFSDDDLARLGVAASGARGKLLRELATYKQQHIENTEDAKHEASNEQKNTSVNSSPKAITSYSSSPTDNSKPRKSEYVGYCFGNPATDKSLHIVTKDSMENSALPTPPNITLSAPPHKASFGVEKSPLSRVSETAASAPAEKLTFSADEIKPASPASPTLPILPTSPTKSAKKKRKSLKVQINGAEFDLEKERKRPLSPFTSGGMLRHLLSPTPPSAPARITQFGPTVDEEVSEMLAEMECRGKAKKTEVVRTTRAERGGALLKRILGRRIGRG